MEIIITERHSDGTPANAQSKDGRYSWFWGADGYIKDSQAGRSIYQMAYLKPGWGSDPLPEDVERDARAFWAALREEEQRAKAVLEERRRVAHEAEMARLRADAPKIAERERLARWHDEVQNEGGEGYNPYRR
ncbi:hypothetical protein C8245_22980 [Paracidovorax avenae]|uniref:hypothetical protein n=1 Tax=Paracidovorax avenae TaxID=80867 RepID=UPI000D2202DB|nr:hypothetical protein [Paracidovorax avenae]AVS68143.1 hypothetical protein C8245_22980 [Paracidovorax avenae]